MVNFLFIGNTDTAKIVHETLKRIFADYSFTRTSPDRMISYARQNKPDIVFVDDESGCREQLQQFKAERSLMFIPMLYIFDQRKPLPKIDDVVESGIDMFIKFPVSPTELEMQINLLMKNRIRYVNKFQKFFDVINNDIPVCIWIVNVEDDGFRYIYQNSYARNAGLPDEQVIGKTTAELTPDIISEEVVQKTEAYYRRCTETGISFSTEEIVSVEGKETWWKTTFSPLHDENNKINRILISSLIISEQRQAEKLLIEREKSYRNLFENNPQPMWIYDVGSLKFLEVNNAASEHYGYSRDEFLSMAITDIRPKEDIHRLLNDIRKKGKFYQNQGEWRHIKKNGEIIDVEVTSHLVIFDNREARHVMITDITEKKQVLKVLNDKNNTLKHAQEIAKMGSWQYVYNSQILTWSDNNYRLFGLQPKEIVPTREYVMSRIYQKDTEKVKKLFASAFHTRKKIEIEYRISFENKPPKWIYTSAIPFFKENQLVCIEGINIDITQRKIFEQELIDARNKAEESDRLKSAFLANMSHEIRTPMSGIMGFLDLLNENNISGEEEKLYKELVKKSGIRLMDTINDMIQVSKIEAEQETLHYEELSVKKELEYYYHFFRVQAKEKNLNLILNLPDDSSQDVIVTDKSKFDSIITNLVKNAIKFTFSGSIELGYRSNQEIYTFFVKDTGVGIPRSRIDAIFDRFVQANLEMSRPHEGSGLGLFIAKAFVEMLGGKIGVESAENEGSIFHFSLNKISLGTLNRNAAEVVEKNAPPYIPANKHKNPCILVAEDDDITWELIEILLSKEKFKLIRAVNGLVAVNFVQQNPDINLVLMDIKMPLLDGYEATMKIRRFNQKIPVIALTAFAMMGDKEKAIAAGCTDYIAKPVNKELLLKKINDTIFEKKQ